MERKYGLSRRRRAGPLRSCSLLGRSRSRPCNDELFGGFPQAFYSAYAEVAPLPEGYSVRKTLYNLYHVLNHANLFGGGYAAQAKAMIERLLAELR